MNSRLKMERTVQKHNILLDIFMDPVVGATGKLVFNCLYWLSLAPLRLVSLRLDRRVHVNQRINLHDHATEKLDLHYLSQSTSIFLILSR